MAAGSVTLTGRIASPSLRSTDPVTIEVAAGGDYKADLEFKRGIVVSGHVRVNGQLLTTGSVGFRPKAPPATYGGSDIGPDGSYEVVGLKEGNYTIVVQQPSINLQTSMARTVTGSETFDLDLMPLTLRGRALDESTRRPIIGVEVVAEQTGNETMSWATPSTTSDSDGSFRLPNLNPGDYRLRATKQGYGAVTQNVTLHEGGDAPIDLLLAPSQGMFVRVVDGRDGHDAAAQITVTDSAGTVVYLGGGTRQEDGSVLVPLKAGSYRAIIGVYQLASVEVQLDAPGRKEVVLTPGGTVVVTSSASSARRARLRSSDGRPAPYSYWDPRRELTITAGTSSLEHIAAGHYTLELLDNNGNPTRSVPFDVTDGATTKLSL